MDFSVKLPAAGENAIIEFGFDELLKLETEFGEDYLARVVVALDKRTPSVISKVILIGLKGGDPEAALRKMSLEDLAGALADGIWLRVKGRRFPAPAEA